MSDTLTFKFKEVFPAETDFLTFITTYGVKATLTAGSDDYKFAQYLYKILYRRYMNSSIQYDMVSEFCNGLAETLENIFDKYKRNKQLIEAIKQLDDESLTIIGENLTNASDNPNNIPDDVRQQLDYITQQNWSMSTTNKLQAYLEAVDSMPEMQINNICREVAKHFKSIYTGNTYLF